MTQAQDGSLCEGVINSLRSVKLSYKTKKMRHAIEPALMRVCGSVTSRNSDKENGKSAGIFNEGREFLAGVIKKNILAGVMYRHVYCDWTDASVQS